MGSELLAKSESEEADIVELSPDGRFIRYDEVLGCGTFKVVYKGFDQDNGIEVAWNQMCIYDDALQPREHRERFIAEAALVKSLKHENIIKCYHSWVDNERKTVNMITESFSSGSLRQYRMKHKSVDVKAIKNWARQILRGLHYLHSHDPPIIHRDLKCDNIFVNGNHGEVKIGDHGLATSIMQQGTARSVIGTPEFMAPELYEEEYNELVDIYSFGMCVLELITCEYPYSECKNQAQIYKKVTSGIKPAALGKVKDPQAKQFIEKCLVPSSQRLPAAELLKDPFLSSGNSKELTCEPLLLPHSSMPQSVDVPKPDSQTSMDIEGDYEKLSASTCTRSMNEPPPVTTLRIRRVTENYQFTLKGEKTDDNSISFILHIITWYGWLDKYEFIFSPDTDDALSVVVELVKVRELPVINVPIVVDLMDTLLLEFVHGWVPSFGYRGEVKSLHKDSSLLKFDQHSLGHPEVENHVVEESIFSDKSIKYNATLASDAKHNKDLGIDECIKGLKEFGSERCEGSVGESVITNEFTKNSEICFADSCSAISSCLSSGISSLSLADKDQCNGLKVEVDAIDEQYLQCCRQLLMLRDEAIENAKKRWIPNRKISVV